MKIYEIDINTRHETELVDITREVGKIIMDSGIKDGDCHLFVPHTTAGITINENADPTVRSDMLMMLNELVPLNNNYSHSEGNSAAHIKSTIVGTSLMLFIENARLVLGTWQGICFCEFDGPRKRNVLIKIVEDQLCQANPEGGIGRT